MRAAAHGTRERSVRCVSYARSSQARAARSCQPLKHRGPAASSGRLGESGRGPAATAAQSGASKPAWRKCARARTAAAVDGSGSSPLSARTRRVAAAGARADDWERVAPGRPMRGMAIGRGRAQAKSTEALGQLSGSNRPLGGARCRAQAARRDTGQRQRHARRRSLP